MKRCNPLEHRSRKILPLAPMMTTCLMRYLLDGNACFPQSLAICVAIFVRLHDIIIRTTANSQGQQNHCWANEQSFHFQFFLEV